MEVEPDVLRAVALSIRARAGEATSGLGVVGRADEQAAVEVRGAMVSAALSLARAVDELGLTVQVAAETYAEVDGAIARAAGRRS